MLFFTPCLLTGFAFSSPRRAGGGGSGAGGWWLVRVPLIFYFEKTLLVSAPSSA